MPLFDVTKSRYLLMVYFPQNSGRKSIGQWSFINYKPETALAKMRKRIEQRQVRGQDITGYSVAIVFDKFNNDAIVAKYVRGMKEI